MKSAENPILRYTYQGVPTAVKNEQATTHDRCAECRQSLRLQQGSRNKCTTNLCASTILNYWLVASSSHQPQIVIHTGRLPRWAKASAYNEHTSEKLHVIQAIQIKAEKNLDSGALEHYRMVDQSNPAVQSVFFHVRAILGTSPSIVTLASWKITQG